MKNYLSFISILLLCWSCVKEPEPIPQIEKSTIVDTLKNDDKIETLGFYILNEGLWNQNNSSLSYFSLKDSSISNQVFESQNHRKLGDTGNDIQAYGNKLYVVMNSSNTLEVIDKISGKSIQHISFLNGNTERNPRKITFYHNKAFISCFDGNVAVLDTTSLSIEKWIKAGRNPEGLTIQNDHLWVANSGGLSYPNYDTSVSKISLENYEEIKKITVQINPSKIISDSQGDIYVLSNGNYGKIKPLIQKINANDNISQLSISPSSIFQHYDSLLFVQDNWIQIYDMKSEKIIDAQFLSTSHFETLTHISIHPHTHEIFGLDAKSYTKTGNLYWFNKNKQLIHTYETRIIPSKLTFITN